jgi:hypothetical protein
MDQNLKDIFDTVVFIKEHMLTKEERATRDDLGDLKAELNTDLTQLEDKIEKLATKNDLTMSQRSMMAELDEIKEQLGNVTGFGKEIDHALERIAAIEKHLSIESRMAA